MSTSTSILDAVMHRLRTDTYYSTEVITRNNPDAVLQRYVAYTGAPAPPNTEALLGKLNAMRASGQGQMVNTILWGIPWRYGVSSGTLDEVFRAWQGEVASRLNDPTNTAKNLPTTGDGTFDPTGGMGFNEDGAGTGTMYGPAPPTGGSTGGGGNALSWAQTITQGMGSLAGLIHVINGGQMPTPGNQTNLQAPQPQTNWTKVVLVGLLLVGVIVGIAFAVKAMKK